MAVKAGYKQTEIGLIPENWEFKTFGQLFDFSGGYSASRDQLSTNGHLYLHYGDIHTSTKCTIDTRLDFHNIPKLEIDIRDISYRSLLNNGDVVFVDASEDDAGVSKHVVIINNDNIPFISGLHTIVAKDKTNEIDNNFKRFCFQANYVRKLFQFYAVGTKVSGISKSNIPKLKLVVPHLPEQQAIAEALSDVDQLIASLDQLIEKRRALKTATMQQLLTGKTRLAGFSASSKLIQTDIGALPKEWPIVQLKSIINPKRPIRYGIVQPGNYDANGRYMIRGQDYSEAKGWADPNDVFKVSAEIEMRYQNARVITGDLIMTIVGYCGHVEIVPEWLNGANLTQTTVRIAIDITKGDAKFCKYVLSSKIGRLQVASYLKGAAQPGLNCGDVEKFFLPFPSLSEQQAIAEVLSDMDAEITELEQRRDKTQAIKQGMMQELLTGRTRLI